MGRAEPVRDVAEVAQGRGAVPLDRLRVQVAALPAADRVEEVVDVVAAAGEDLPLVAVVVVGDDLAVAAAYEIAVLALEDDADVRRFSLCSATPSRLCA